MPDKSRAVHGIMLQYAALGSGLGWVGLVGSRFSIYLGVAIGLLKLELKVILCTICLTMPLTRHLRY